MIYLQRRWRWGLRLHVPAVILAVMAVSLCGLVSARAGTLEAGLARVVITPRVGVALGGYADRRGVSTGVHDELRATVLLLRADGVSVAIVSCDLLSFASERVVAEARARGLADHVLIAATHTHSGPGGEGAWRAEVEEKILRAIGEAAAATFPARIAAGAGEIYLGHNRRLVERAGLTATVKMLWRNAEKRPTSPVDPTVGVIRIDDEAGRVRGILVNYACHAVVLGPDNREISADYPGAMASEVEREFPGAMALFVQGGAGDINPYLDKQPVAQNGFGEAERTGRALGAEAVRVARRLTPVALSGRLLASSEVFSFANRKSGGPALRAGLTTLLIDNRIAICTMPGEPFVDLQIALRDKSEVAQTFLFGYTFSAGGEWVGYIPTLRAAVEGGYGASTSTRIELGAGEAMVDRAIATLYRLAGKLKDTPNP